MANKDRDSKCLDLALKYIETLEAQLNEVETDLGKSAGEHYKKNKVLNGILKHPELFEKFKLEFSSKEFNLANMNDDLRMEFFNAK